MFAAVRADWWDDFSNNLATDLSPLLALFGEQVTKQFLSESLSLWDNFIFAMAPLGIVTAIVSAIRVCGGPSLRAFIGRAQEGGGIAEAELCSSTSRDVCELYHNGAIVRVFGRPKILEVVHDIDQADFSYGVNDPKRLTPPKCGIYFFKDYINDGLAEKAGWKETGSVVNPHDGRPRNGFRNVCRRLMGRHRLGKDNLHDMNQQHTGIFAPNPNLSFNIGIKKYPVYVYWAAAGVGLLSEAAVVVYGAFATYHLRYKKDDALPHAWAFPFMALGTVILSLGMFCCAFLVERSTQERIFRKFPQNSAKPSSASLYITQPGNQTIGDQTYDAFAFSDSLEELKEYITSWKLPRQSDEQRMGVWFAAGATMLGFIFQFIGLRGLHSSVSIVLLGAIVIMSIVRSSLRTGRLKQERNLLYNRPE